VPPLFGLAPGGVCRAARVAAGAVRSYRTVSPLPAAESLPGAGGLFSVALSLGSPPPGVTRHRASMEPGLSSPGPKKGRKRPSGRLARIEIRGAGGGVNLRAKVPDCQSRRAGLLSGRGAALVMPFV